MEARSAQIKPSRGMILAFAAASSAELADIPATVIDIWPRLPSGDYLVVLEYDQPVRLGNHLIRQMGALVSELYIACTVDERGPRGTRVGFQYRVRRSTSGRCISCFWQRVCGAMVRAMESATAEAPPPVNDSETDYLWKARRISAIT